jgi:hypothetical protein
MTASHKIQHDAKVPFGACMLQSRSQYYRIQYQRPCYQLVGLVSYVSVFGGKI